MMNFTEKEKKVLPPISEVLAFRSTIAYYKLKCKEHLVYILGRDDDFYIVFGLEHAHKAGLSMTSLEDLPKPIKKFEDFEPIDLALVEEYLFKDIVGKSDLAYQKEWRLEELQKEAFKERPELAQEFEKKKNEDEEDQVLVMPNKRQRSI